jgi:carbonic anhydrase/acetyltransferase-like protein (isoleucine patch superfamily)
VVVRGDVNRITIGENTNIQDGAVVHCTYQKHETRIGADVSVGHNAVVHGCRLHDRVLVGMGATVMDGAVVKSNVLIAAGALVPPGAELDPGYLYAGVPAKQIRLLTSEESEMIAQTALNYKMYAGWYRGG